jgi:hypothetical protein
MRFAALFLLVLSFQITFSQTAISLEGRITDQKTNEPLAYVNVYLSGTNYGTVTNQSGYFTLKYPVTLNAGTITFSHIGYKSSRISLQVVENEFVAVALEVQPVELDEVVVKPVNPLDVVYNSIKRIPENYNLNSYSATGFQREHVSHSDKIIQLLEATFKTTSPGHHQEPVSTILDARYIEDKKEKAPLWSPSRGGFYTFGWTTVSGIVQPDQRQFLGIEINKKSDLAKHYEFTIEETVFADKTELYVIAFDQRKDVRRGLLKGIIYIDAASGAIVKLVHALSPRGIKHLNPHETYGGQVISTPPKKLEIRKDRCETTYRKYGSKWYLHTLVHDAEFDASLVFFRIVNSQKLTLNYHSERIVTIIDTTRNAGPDTQSNITEIGKTPTLQNFIKKEFENYEQHETGKWSDQNIIRSDTSFASIANQLQANNQAWESTTGLAAAEAATKVHFKSNQLMEDLEFLKASLEGIHPGLYWYTSKEKLDKEFNLVKQKLKTGGTESDFFELLCALIEQIHCGHTNLMLSNNKTRLLKSGARFPLEVSIYGDSAIVSSSIHGVDTGSQILAINGHPTPQIIQTIKATIPSDGFNTTYKEYRIRKEFGRLFGNHFGSSDTFNIKVQNADGRVREEILPGIDNDDIEPGMSNTSSFKIIDSLQTALLTIPSFAEEGFADFLQDVFAQLNNEKIRNLIIDIRNNEGGRDEDGLTLFSYLARGPFEYYKKITVATSDTAFLSRLSFGTVPFNTALPDYTRNIVDNNFRSHSNLGMHQPQVNAFRGQVYVLMNGGTFSTAAEFASITHANGRAVFIGTETGGGYHGNCSLGTPTITLPNSKLRVAIPLGKYELAVPNSIPPGRGLIPDFQIVEYSTDLLRNNDKVLEYCFGLIAKRDN